MQKIWKTLTKTSFEFYLMVSILLLFLTSFLCSSELVVLLEIRVQRRPVVLWLNSLRWGLGLWLIPFFLRSIEAARLFPSFCPTLRGFIAVKSRLFFSNSVPIKLGFVSSCTAKNLCRIYTIDLNSTGATLLWCERFWNEPYEHYDIPALAKM